MSPLPDLLLLDQDLVPAAEATVSALDRGLLYGESLFETLKVVDGAPCLWPEHARRLAAGAAELGLPLDLERLERGVRRLLAARPVTGGALRVQVTGGVQPGGGRGMTAPPEGRRPRVVGTVVETTPLPAARYRDGVDVVTAADLRRPLPWLKSGSYLASVAAKGRAEAAGAFECLFGAGEPASLLEGTFSNILGWDGVRLTVVPARQALPGVTQAAVLAAAADLGIALTEGPLLADAVLQGGLFLTGSLLGICPCRSLGGRALGGGGRVTGGPDALAFGRETADRLREGLARREADSRRAWIAAG
jgi:branched-chain amino acid aminotransferase